MQASMGSVCCVAAKDRAGINGSTDENLQRNFRHSPSWSFRWDSRGRVAGEETSVNWSSDGVGRNDSLEFKSSTNVETVYASEEGSPLDSFRSLAWQKSPVSDGNTRNLMLPLSDPSPVRNSTEVKASTTSLAISYPSPVKLLPSAPSTSSLSTSSLSSQSQQLPASFTPGFPHHSGHQLGQQVSDSRIPGLKSPTFSISEESSSLVLPGWSNESNRGSHGGSSDGWSIPAFPDLLANPRRDRWSFDSESLGFHRERVTIGGGRSSASFDLQTCGICAKLFNELAVIAVLDCGHVYHAECLENMTPEINKYDPACPVCTFGEKQTLKMFEKAMKAQIDLKARKRFRNRIVDSDFSGNLSQYDCQKSSEHEGRCPKMSSSSSMKSSSGRPFLKRHFSFGLKKTRSYSESSNTRKKGFFWTRSSKE